MSEIGRGVVEEPHGEEEDGLKEAVASEAPDETNDTKSDEKTDFDPVPGLS